MKWSRLHIAVLSAFVFLFTGPAVSFLQAFEGRAPSIAFHAFTPYEGAFTPIESGEKQIHLKSELSPFPELYSTSDLGKPGSLIVESLENALFLGRRSPGASGARKSPQTKDEVPIPSVADSSLPTSISSDEDETALQNVLIYSASHRYHSQTRDFSFQVPVKRIAHRPMESGVAIGAP